MFSSRLHWNLHPNRLTQLLQSKRREGDEILDLTESNPTHAGLSYPAKEMLDAFYDQRSLIYEPVAAGLEAARAAVAGYYAARGGHVELERILLTASTSEAYGYLFKLLTDPGDEVLVPRPSYPLFEFLATMEMVRVVQYPLSYHGNWSIDLDALERAISARTRAVVLVNPNNPTGTYVKIGELQKLIEICSERQLALICDEVFADFPFGPDATRVSSLTDVDRVLTFCLSGLSKIAGLPQVKLGWIVTGGPDSLRAQAIERLELIADTYLSVGTPVQHAAPRLLKLAEGLREQIAQRAGNNLSHLRSCVREESPCRILEVEGGWYATLQVPRVRSEEEWTLKLLESDNVLVQPGFFYDFDSEAFLVLSLLTAPTVFQEGVCHLLARVEAV